MVNQVSEVPVGLERIAGSLFGLSRALRSAAQRRSLNHAGLRRGDLGLLRVLVEYGPQRPSAVAEHLGVGPSVVSRQLAPLRADGLITRRSDPADGRAEIVEITEAGRTRVADLMREYVAHLVSHLEHWDADRIDDAVNLLDELTEAVNRVSNSGTAVAAPSERPTA